MYFCNAGKWIYSEQLINAFLFHNFLDRIINQNKQLQTASSQQFKSKTQNMSRTCSGGKRQKLLLILIHICITVKHFYPYYLLIYCFNN